MWGQRLNLPIAFTRYRFTPTRVGTTIGLIKGNVLATVHPHACGDNGQVTADRILKTGSPPRVWGQLLYRDCDDR